MTAVSTDPVEAAGASGQPLLRVEDLKVHFDTDAGIVKAVDGVSFSVAAGETLAVVGESGSGKSVTGMSLLGLLPRSYTKTTGSVRWQGQELVGASEPSLRKVRGRQISMIFQDAMTSLNPVFTIGHQITEMIELHLDLKGKAARRRAVEMLSAVGIPEAAKRYDMYPHEFSGGMRQRAMIAMAISCDPKLIIADEPTTALDVTVQAQVLDVLAEIKDRTGAGIILITHDLGVVAGVADRVMVMYAGKQVETSVTDDVFYDTRHPYTLGLMASLPRLDTDGAGIDPEAHRLTPIEGQPPSLLSPPPGCSFHPRCPLASLPAPCRTEEPALRELDPGHWSACHYAHDLVARAVDVGGEAAELVLATKQASATAAKVQVPDERPRSLPPAPYAPPVEPVSEPVVPVERVEPAESAGLDEPAEGDRR